MKKHMKPSSGSGFLGPWGTSQPRHRRWQDGNDCRFHGFRDERLDGGHQDVAGKYEPVAIVDQQILDMESLRIVFF